MLRVRDMMTRDVITLSPDASAAEAWGVCQQNKIRHLPVMDGDRLVGLVSDRDLRDVSPPRRAGTEEDTLGWVRLRDIMSTDLVTIHPLDTIEHAAREIYERKIGCLLAVADGELAGIITSQDLMHALVELVGAHGAGSWVEVEVPDKPGTLADVTDVLRDRSVNISSVFLGPAPHVGNKLIVLRLETTQPSSIARALEEAGYGAVVVESSAPVRTTLEEA